MRARNLYIKTISLLIVICSIITYNMIYYNKVLTVTEAAITDTLSSTNTDIGPYNDGTFIGSARGFGGQVTCRVVIKDGYIAEISVDSAQNEDAAYYNMALSVLDEISLDQSADNIDTVSGATYTSNGLIGACKEALDKAGKR